MKTITELREAHGSNSFDKTKNVGELATEINRLDDLQTRIKTQEDHLAEMKREEQRLSGEVVPLLLAERIVFSQTCRRLPRRS